MDTVAIIENGVKELDFQDLKPGDIIVVRSPTNGARFVCATTIGRVSHAMIVTSEKQGLFWAVDATPDFGVNRVS